MDGLTVSALSRRVGATPDTVRYYERLGLLHATRSPSGYRLFDEANVERMRFIQSARRFGLQLHEIRDVLEIRERGLCPCGHARALLRVKLAEVEAHLAALAQLRDDLRELLDRGMTTSGDACWPCAPVPPLVQIESRNPND